MTKPSLLTLVVRGVRKTCPNCGEGELFGGYIKQVPECTACGEVLSHIQADDAPPWLTIFIVGHVMISLVMHLETTYKIPVLWEIAGVLSLAVVLTGVLLPICKGIVIAIMWNVMDRQSPATL